MKCVAIDHDEQRCPKDIEWRVYYFGDERQYPVTKSMPQWVYVFLCDAHVGTNKSHAFRVDKNGELTEKCSIPKPQKG